MFKKMISDCYAGYFSGGVSPPNAPQVPDQTERGGPTSPQSRSSTRRHHEYVVPSADTELPMHTVIGDLRERLSRMQDDACTTTVVAREGSAVLGSARSMARLRTPRGCRTSHQRTESPGGPAASIKEASGVSITTPRVTTPGTTGASRSVLTKYSSQEIYGRGVGDWFNTAALDKDPRLDSRVKTSQDTKDTKKTPTKSGLSEKMSARTPPSSLKHFAGDKSLTDKPGVVQTTAWKALHGDTWSRIGVDHTLTPRGALIEQVEQETYGTGSGKRTPALSTSRLESTASSRHLGPRRNTSLEDAVQARLKLSDKVRPFRNEEGNRYLLPHSLVKGTTHRQKTSTTDVK